jgi:hypothetical protein
MSYRPLGFLFPLVFVVFSAAALWLMCIEPGLEGIPINFEQILQKTRFQNNMPLKSTYTGIQRVDALLSGLVVASLPGTAGWEAEIRLRHISFLFNFFSIVCI